jgi:Zn-dependent peptidase ImmA (M78 family)/DNA-binding XRE family transcriptional regulator
MRDRPKRVEAAVRAELLIWARESAGYSVEAAAHKAQVKPEQLARWEAGERRPTITQLRTLARVYKRPLAVFFLTRVPKTFQVMHDFRRLPGEVAGVESPELRLEIRRATYRREVALDLYALRGETPPAFDARASLSEDPEVVGSRARGLLGVSYEAQTAWQGLYDGFNAWRSAIEGLGVLVFQAEGVEPAEMRGFSLGEQPLPVVVTNIKESPRGRTFTILHEFIHLMLHEEGLCDLSEHASLRPEDRQVEVFANQAAAAALMPRDKVLAEALVRAHHTGAVWSEEELRQLARRYQVSREAMLRRLLTLGRTTQEFYRAKREQFLEEYKGVEQGGFAPPFRKAIAAAGSGYVRLVLDSYYREHITASDLAEFLGVRLKHMPKIEAAVFGRAVECRAAS